MGDDLKLLACKTAVSIPQQPAWHIAAVATGARPSGLGLHGLCGMLVDMPRPMTQREVEGLNSQAQSNWCADCIKQAMGIIASQ